MKQVQLVDKTFSQQLSEKKRLSAVKWGSINVCFLSALYFDIHQKKKFFDENDYFFYLECVSCVILALSFLTNVMTFIYHTFFVDNIVCDNEEQKILLNLSNSTVKSPPKKPAASGNVASFNDTINMRNLSFSEQNTSLNNTWLSNASGQLQTSAFSINQDTSYNEANSFQSPSKYKTEFIMDRSGMDQYLKNAEQHEKDIASAIEAQNNMNGYMGTNFNSFWGNCRFDEIIASLKTSLYQLSPHNTKQSSRDESYSINDQENNSEIIRMMNPNKLSSYVANLKMWISKTILEPLIVAIDDTDKAFQERGFTDMKIGSVGLERLKKMASTSQHLLQNIPMLPKLIPFLELTTNQEYIVQRIRELAKGSCMKNYKFNSVSFSQPEQADHIPSDAGIIFHLFCTYLDSQLHPMPDIPRAFYSRYVVVGDVKKSSVENILKEIGKNKAKCGILSSNPITPKFNFISDKVHTASYDRNNLFYVIIQFLIHLSKDGWLESVNLGKSGINILNILNLRD